MLDRVKAGGAIVVALLTGSLLVWWLALVAQRLGVRPVVENGSVVLDEFQRAKDVLLVVLPLFSASIAFFVGNAGAENARSEAAKEKAKAAALLTVSTEDSVARARALNPAAFE